MHPEPRQKLQVNCDLMLRTIVDCRSCFAVRSLRCMATNNRQVLAARQVSVDKPHLVLTLGPDWEQGQDEPNMSSDSDRRGCTRNGTR